ncbi:ester cyclase [Streptomyces luteireticuli]|uniref:Ester cyclase n=1 Tax=Streptomyces luteireticuli TaxID=173858 RepID=A0ABN0Z596_9ACTN
MFTRTIALGAAVACLVAGGIATAAVRTTPVRTTPARTTDTWPGRLVDPSPGLVRPRALTVDRSLGERRAALEVRLAQRLYTFWNTGDRTYLRAAISPHFKDNTLPAGRPQGPAGPVFASKRFRTAVPDLTCELSDVLITGDKITARLVFRGHFTGTLDGVRGRGQKIGFNALDIQHVGTDRITEDWHIEDNGTLSRQMNNGGVNKGG